MKILNVVVCHNTFVFALKIKVNKYNFIQVNICCEPESKPLSEILRIRVKIDVST